MLITNPNNSRPVKNKTSIDPRPRKKYPDAKIADPITQSPEKKTAPTKGKR